MRPRIGVIGAGVIGTFHGKAIHTCIKLGLVDADFVAVCDADRDRAQSYARSAGLAVVTTDPDELIGSPDVNTIYVCTPTVSHRELTLKALGAGKAVFCEKPLAFNAQDAAEMRDAAKAAGVTHQVGLVLRYSPVITVMRDLIREPSSGRPMSAVMIDDQFFPIQGHYRSTWRGDVTQVGAGTLLEHAIHDIDVLVWCFGEVRRVHGVIRSFFGKEGVEDLSAATLEFESGAVASHVSIWHDIRHRGSSRRMFVTCERAQVSWEDDDWTGAIRIDSNAAGGRTDIPSEAVLQRYYAREGLEDDRLRSLAARYSLEDYAFLRAVSEERPSFPDFDTAVYAHRVVDAIYRSAREGRPVDVA
ncbi:MAG TPA: Gfo/Idh/MocA family oxidoreductase [Dehalococcoidia bacterium]|nr:Gfo/Idh/MocA family oxidoreductase [Dehalococcoidia bacterium]